MSTEDVKPIETEPLGAPLATSGGSGGVDGGPMMLSLERAKQAKQHLKAALSLVQPGQFVVMASQDKETGEMKESIYATGGASDRILRMGFGFRWSESRITVEEDEDGNPISATCTADLLMQDGSIYETFTGRRSMGGYIKTRDNLMKGVRENMKHQAVTDLLGLRFLTPADLAELGVDVKALPRRAEYQDRGRDETGAAMVPWGNKKGTPVTELTEKDLAYYMGKAKEALEDKSKQKFHAKEQIWLKACESELDRRKNPPPAAKEAPPMSKEDAEAFDMGAVRLRELGQQLGLKPEAVDKRISELKSLAEMKTALDDMDKAVAKRNEAKKE